MGLGKGVSPSPELLGSWPNLLAALGEGSAVSLPLSSWQGHGLIVTLEARVAPSCTSKSSTSFLKSDFCINYEA